MIWPFSRTQRCRHDWERITGEMWVAKRDEFDDHPDRVAGAQCRKCFRIRLRTFYGSSGYWPSDVVSQEAALDKTREVATQGPVLP